MICMKFICFFDRIETLFYSCFNFERLKIVHSYLDYFNETKYNFWLLTYYSNFKNVVRGLK